MKKKIIMSLFVIVIALFGFSLKSNADTISLGKKYDSLWHYKLNGYTNMNLYCAQEGGRLSSWYANTYNKYSWGYNSNTSSVFKSETAYKKITWIKNHIWEQTDKNLYSYQEIYDILSSSGQSITLSDVETVYSSQNNKFKLYQLISWTYTNGNSVTVGNYLSGSLLKVYNAIIALADANYSNQSTQDDLSIKSNGDPTKTDSTITWTFTASTNNPASINVYVYENGDNITSSKATVTQSGTTITVKVTGYDNTEDNTYQIIFKQPQVIGTGTIYTHSSTQNMILISTSRNEKTYTYTDEVEGIDGYFNVEILKKDKNTGNSISGIGFSVSGSVTASGTTGSDGKYKFVNSKEIEASGTTYEYTITESENDDYVILQDSIGIKLISGVKKSGDKKYYAITYAAFSSGETEETVELVNGTEVTLKIESSSSYSESNGGTSTITITVENVEKRFDLALTKSITKIVYNYSDSVKIYDSALYKKDSDTYIGNSYVIIKLSAQLNVNSDSFEKYGDLKDMDTWDDELFTEFINFLRNDLEIPIMSAEVLAANGITQKNLYDRLDVDSDGEIRLNDAYTNLVEYQNEFDEACYSRLNSADATNLNKLDENGNLITTAEYNLNKSSVQITKEGEIKYVISVYNEGDIDAKEIEITDYIPAGLVVIDDEGEEVTSGSTVTYTNNNVEYTWTITINDDGTTTAVIKVLTGSSDSLSHYVEGELQNVAVPIYCKVTKDTEVGELYYNVAEITSASPTSPSDRDSTPDNIDDSNVEELIDDYSENYENELSEDETLEEKKIDKSVYNYEDDDDFEVIEVRTKKFDLSLRKSITKVGSSESSMEDVTYEDEDDSSKQIDRLPEITLNSAFVCLVSGTGEYYHKKEAVSVTTGDYVEYTIRVYNEGSSGDYSGYASQITDYLPDELEFYAIVNQDSSWTTLTNNTAEQTDNTNGFGKFIATYDENNNKITLDYVEGDINAIRPKQCLLEIYANSQVKITPVTYYTTEEMETSDSDLFSYQEVRIICKVTAEDDGTEETEETVQYLTNIAEITEEKYLTKGEYKVACEENGVVDSDSTPGTISIGEEYDKTNQVVNLSTYYELDCNGSTGVDDSFVEYYAGLEDDDDFETIMVYGEPKVHKGVKEVENQDSGYYDEITGNTYNSIDEVESVLHDWVIQTDICYDIEDFTKYIVKDTIDERLEFTGLESVTVKIVDGEDLVEGTDYVLNYDETTRELSITFIDTSSGMSASDLLVSGKGGKIEIRYNTTFAKDEIGNIIGLNEEISNQATLTYNNGHTGEKTRKSENPEVHTGGIKILKYTTVDNEKVALEGATFKIAETLEDAQQGNWLQNANGEDITGVSDEDGIVKFVGLEFGGDAMSNESNLTIDSTTGAEVYDYDYSTVSSTYYIVETIAPEGYILDSTPLEVTLTKDSYDVEVSSMPSVENVSYKFDLALRKWVTQAIVTMDGVTTVTETGHTAEDDPEEIVKVDLKKSKIDSVTVKFKYSIRVTNEGQIAGYATELRDDIPDGLKFVAEDNPDWREENGQIVTNALETTLLQPGESAEVEIILTWINGSDNMGVKTNVAEINKDYNDYGEPDIDSTPGNNVEGEDDIDDAPVMLTVKTGALEIIKYLLLVFEVLGIITTGIVLIKKKVLKKPAQ